MQTAELLQSASDFMTSGEESGGGKSGAQRRRTVKDKPRKPRMKPEGDAEGDPGLPGMLYLGFRVILGFEQQVPPEKGKYCAGCWMICSCVNLCHFLKNTGSFRKHMY